MNTQKELMLYRFHDCIALNTDTDTIYLTHKQAKELKNAINKAFRDTKKNPKFTNSNLGTLKIKG